MNNQLEQLRTECACNKCKAACKTMPGYLIPGDVERIINHHKLDPLDIRDWFAYHFEASEGTTAIKVVGDEVIKFHIPTIVPAQQDSGRCVFLDDEDRCTIHSVAPFGCSMMNFCETSEEDKERSLALSKCGLQACMESIRYKKQWRVLFDRGSHAKPVRQRKQALTDAVRKIESDNVGTPNDRS